MDLKRKHEIAQQAIDSIISHEDEDLSVRRAFVESLIMRASDAMEAKERESAERVRALLVKD